MSDIILHHFPTSPFAEKVRVALGIKGISWRSVTIPMVMPKPDLVALTGGYRKTPVMQIGADIYCDTQCILRELERRHPEPSLYRGTDAGTANALAFWSDRNLFSPAVGLALGSRSEAELPQDFIEDRSKFSGRPIDLVQLRAAAPILVEQLRSQLVWYENALADGRPFVCGTAPTLVDCALYHVCWFMQRSPGLDAAPLAEHVLVRAWMARVAAIGHGHPSELTSTGALELAQRATPQTVSHGDPHDPFGRKPGDRVQISADDSGREPTVGELIALTREEIVIARRDERAGDVAVHFPRAGFIVKPAG
jgi:glutathione S-transferase